MVTLKRKVCQDKNCPLQGLYPFSKTTFQGFSRTSPGLKLIFPGLKNSLSAINFLYCHFSLRIWCSILPVVYEFLNSYHLTNGSKRVNDFSVVGAFLKFSSSSLTVWFSNPSEDSWIQNFLGPVAFFAALFSPGKCHSKILQLSRFSRTHTNPALAFTCICKNWQVWFLIFFMSLLQMLMKIICNWYW